MPETAPLGGTMSDLNGNDAESNQDAEDREAQLLCLKIKDHLEEMFSDSHLAEDGFLLKHMQKNKQGYVSLKLLTCLKKIKALTTNWYMTLAAAECSDLLELNEECTKVRRKEALPQWLMCSPTSRLLLIWNASEEQSGEDGADPGQSSLLLSILQRFDSPGDVASVWILHPGEELPKELQCYAKRHKELGQILCAVMKFNSLESVRRAYSSLREEEKINGRGLCVVPLGWQSVQSINKFDPSENKGDATCSMGDPQNISQVLLEQDLPSPLRFSEETGEAYSPPAVQEDSNCSQKSLRGLTKRYSWTDWCSGDRNTPFSQCPWVLKRKSAASAAKLETAEHLNTTGLILKVLRQPFGPDDTKGFNARRQKYDFLE